MNHSRVTQEQAIQKMKQYCAYQERCRSEVMEKLYSFDLSKVDIEEIILKLIEENYLDEERFATQFAGGKFRIKQWGKIKIKHALKQKNVGDQYIKKALDQINENDYLQALEKIAFKKQETLIRERNTFAGKKKLQDFLLQKGYEGHLVSQLIKDLP